MAFGIIGIEMFQQQTQATLKIGQNLQLAGYTVTFDDLKEYMLSDAQLVGQAEMSVERNGRPLGTIQPRVDFFFDAQQTMTIPGIRSTLEDDLYVILVDWEAISRLGRHSRSITTPGELDVDWCRSSHHWNAGGSLAHPRG
jgi:cytochrome c-type biogenesis protein CcmF